MRLVGTEEMCGHGRAERTAPDDNDVEGARVVLWAAVWAAPILVRRSKGFVEPVAHISPEDVSREVGHLRSCARDHGSPTRCKLTEPCEPTSASNLHLPRLGSCRGSDRLRRRGRPRRASDGVGRSERARYCGHQSIDGRKQKLDAV